MEMFTRNSESSLYLTPMQQDKWNKKGDNAIRATRKQPSSRVSNVIIGLNWVKVKPNRLGFPSGIAELPKIYQNPVKGIDALVETAAIN